MGLAISALSILVLVLSFFKELTKKPGKEPSAVWRNTAVLAGLVLAGSGTLEILKHRADIAREQTAKARQD